MAAGGEVAAVDFEDIRDGVVINNDIGDLAFVVAIEGAHASNHPLGILADGCGRCAVGDDHAIAEEAPLIAFAHHADLVPLIVKYWAVQVS